MLAPPLKQRTPAKKPGFVSDLGVTFYVTPFFYLRNSLRLLSTLFKFEHNPPAAVLAFNLDWPVTNCGQNVRAAIDFYCVHEPPIVILK